MVSEVAYNQLLWDEQNARLATPEELASQAAYFSDVFITRQLLDAMPGVVFILNACRQIVHVNRSMLDLLALDSSATLLGRRPGDVLDCSSAVVAEHGCGSGPSCQTCGALVAIMAGLGGAESVQECLLTRQLGAVEEPLTLRVWSSPVSFAGQQFTVLAGMDVSNERRRLALERTFFHDILNLVGSIRGLAEIMQGGDPEDYARIGLLIQSASQRVINEIDAQRLLLAAEKHQLQATPGLLQSRTLLEELIELHRTQPGGPRPQLVLSADTETFAFACDGPILGRILGNMIKNALEASLPGERVIVGVRRDAGRALFWINNPAVIPEHHQSRIFQRDFSTKGAGRGLGTYSMKLLADVLGGSVAFDSRPDTGTTFRVVIPLDLVPPAH